MLRKICADAENSLLPRKRAPCLLKLPAGRAVLVEGDLGPVRFEAGASGLDQKIVLIGLVGLHPGEGDSLAEGRGKGARGNAAHFGTVRQGQLVAVAGGAAAFELQGNEVFPHRIKSLAAHEIGSALHHTAHAGLDRGVFLIEFVAVERQAGFHAQRVTGAEAGGLHARIAEQGFPEINGVFGVNAELVAELAGIARAADQQLLAIPFRLAEGEVPEVAQVLTEQLFENVHGKRALKVNLGDFIGFVHDGDAGGQTFCYGLEITINAGGVDNDKEGGIWINT